MPRSRVDGGPELVVVTRIELVRVSDRDAWGTCIGKTTRDAERKRTSLSLPGS